MNERPLVGLGLMLLKDGKVLLGKRKSALGNGEYSGLGGHLEALESFEESLLREVAEEGGPDLKLKNLRFLCVSNLTKYAPKHYVDIGMIADWESGEPQVMEPKNLKVGVGTI
jgi:8-oxo-dGTP diphosphatase